MSVRDINVIQIRQPSSMRVITPLSFDGQTSDTNCGRVMALKPMMVLTCQGSPTSTSTLISPSLPMVAAVTFHLSLGSCSVTASRDQAIARALDASLSEAESKESYVQNLLQLG